MADRYTWENVIFNPKSDEVKNIIGKECYFGDSPAECLKRANAGMCMGISDTIIEDGDNFVFKYTDTFE